MIPFDSWDGVGSTTGTEAQIRLERYFGPTAVVFSSYQAAIAAVLEVLGSRSSAIPVVLSVTASPDTLSAVLRSGASPFLLDIDPGTLQMDPDALREVVAELKTPVVILDRPGGQPVLPELLDLVQDCVSVIDTRLPPCGDVSTDCVGSFTVFDLGLVAGSGGLVHHKYSEQVSELKVVRNGVLGLAASMPELVAASIYQRLSKDAGKHQAAQHAVAAEYLRLLQDTLPLPFLESPAWPYFVVGVDNADRVVAHLHSHDIHAVKPVFPLHLVPLVARRWAEQPSYPSAEMVHNNLVALPTHSGVAGQESHIVRLLLEV